MERNTEALGRKIFCINLPQKYAQSLIPIFVHEEYEAYALDGPDSLPFVLEQHPRSVLFLYTDSLTEDTGPWQEFFSTENERLTGKDFQWVFTYPGREATVFLGRPALGLIEGVNSSVKEFIIAKLESLHARGQRRYVRFGGTDDINVAFTFSVKGNNYEGFVYDISSAGMSCAFGKETCLDLNTFIDKITLTLGGTTYTITGKILLQRWLDNEKRLFVVMFDRRMPPGIREVLQYFIHSSLQAKMLARLKQGY